MFLTEGLIVSLQIENSHEVSTEAEVKRLKNIFCGMHLKIQLWEKASEENQTKWDTEKTVVMIKAISSCTLWGQVNGAGVELQNHIWIKWVTAEWLGLWFQWQGTECHKVVSQPCLNCASGHWPHLAWKAVVVPVA